MSSRNILDGGWINIKNEGEFNNLLRYSKTNPTQAEKLGHNRVQLGKYDGPDKYYVLHYSRPCPRGCCYDNVIEILTKEETAQEVSEAMRDLSYILKQARTK